MGNRIKTPKPIETELLLLSARRCCLCFGLDQDISEKRGQIAHLDKNNSNNKIDNLAWLCLFHHDPYDGKTSQSKNYQISEVKKYREELYRVIVEKRIQLIDIDIEPEKPGGYYQRFSAEYIGRDENVKHVLDFLNNPDQHFMLLYGIGGMGKSHLISECRERFEDSAVIHKEGNLNYTLKTLFNICNIPYPEELSDASAIQQRFLDEFCDRNIILILDDFYEIIDKEVRDLLPKFTKIAKGKILLVSRIIPEELTQTGMHVNAYEVPSLIKEDFITVIQNYIQSEGKIVTIADQDLNKIYNKAQGYPLRGQLIVDLLDMEEKLADILKNLSKFQAKRDPEGKQFINRLLDNIFKKGSRKEIDLLCEFSALYEFSSIDVVKQLPSFDFNAFEALVKRRKFIVKEADGSFHCHTMIKDFAFEKLSEKEAVYKAIGKYYEKILFQNNSLNSEILGITYRENNQKELAIDTFLKGLKVEPENVRVLYELGITYRENDQKQLAIDTFQKIIEEIDPKHAPSYSELGIIYREKNQFEEAIQISEKALAINPKHEPSLINLLQIYLYFKPEKTKAKVFYDKLNDMPQAHRSFKKQRKNYEVSIENLDSIWNLTIDEFKIYDRYIFAAIQHKA